MHAAEEAGGPARTKDRERGNTSTACSVVQLGDLPLQGGQGFSQRLALRVLEHHPTLVKGTDHESLSRFDADFDPPQALDPAGRGIPCIEDRPACVTAIADRSTS